MARKVKTNEKSKDPKEIKSQVDALKIRTADGYDVEVADLNDRAGVYESQGRYAEAEPLYRRAQSIYEKFLGPEHPDVATPLNNLAFLYRLQGRYSEAEPLYKRALEILEKVLGTDHPNTEVVRYNLKILHEKNSTIGTGG